MAINDNVAHKFRSATDGDIRSDRAKGANISGLCDLSVGVDNSEWADIGHNCDLYVRMTSIFLTKSQSLNAETGCYTRGLMGLDAASQSRIKPKNLISDQKRVTRRRS